MHKYTSNLLAVGLVCTLGACAQRDAPNARTGGGDTGGSPAAAATPAAAAGPSLAAAPSGTYTHDKGHSYLAFSYDHKGYSAPHLLFRTFDVTLEHNADDLSKSAVSVDIDVASIDSGVEKFDKHLRSADFFDVANYPQATFRTTAFESQGSDGRLTGVLTIKDVSKPVTLNVTLNKVGSDRDGQPKLGFSARGDVLRSDFDVGLYAPAVGDNVSLIIESEFEKAD